METIFQNMTQKSTRSKIFEIPIIKTDPKIKLKVPKYETKGSAGLDLTANLKNKKTFSLKPGQRTLVPTGIKIALPRNMEAQIRPRSGLALKYGVTVLNSPGTIDSDFRGEIKVILINLGEKLYKVKYGERIAQIVFNKIEKIKWIKVKKLTESKRGTGGFGSTNLRKS